MEAPEVLSSTLGVARCGRSAGCVLCALWAVLAAVLVGGVPCGGKHIITPLREPGLLDGMMLYIERSKHP